MSRYSRFAYEFRSLHGVDPASCEVEEGDFRVISDPSGFPRAIGAGSPPPSRRNSRAEEAKLRRLTGVGLGALFVAGCAAFAFLVLFGLGVLALLAAGIVAAL